jgi:hypothetical protein
MADEQDVLESSPDELQAVDEFLKANASAIAEEEGKVFELIGATLDEKGQFNPLSIAEAPELPPEEQKKQLSILQKIAGMNVAQKVKLAMLGNKEERMVLIRDGSKVVSGAVLASPKISDQEIETIAAMKNVQESVLRDLARNRKFMKSYIVVKNLVNNPRCPLDLSLGLIKNLIAPDLKALSMNKNVGETLRKMALKMFKEKTTPPGQKSGGH